MVSNSYKRPYTTLHGKALWKWQRQKALQENSSKVLLQARANMEQRMVGGDTALHQAAWQGHVAESFRELIPRSSLVLALRDKG